MATDKRYSDIHSNEFDPVRMSAGELAKADSLTRAAATEALNKKYRGNFDYHAFSHTDSTGGNGERGSASRAKRWAGSQTRAKQYMYNDAIQAEQQRESLDRQVLAGRDKMKSMEGELASLKEQVSTLGAAGVKPEEKGDMQIDGVTDEDLERSAAKGKAQDWLNSNSQPTSSGIFNSDGGDQQAPTAEGAGEEKAFNNEKYMIDFGSQATNKKAIDFSGV